ncbi:MAG: amidohydrolase family protein [Clostridia bacterium]|nr:amidohydrolase family protein [Clostridia bacterium]
MIQGKYTVIDAHCHIYPEKIASRAVNGTDTFYGLSSFGEGTVRHLLGVGEESGIDGYLVQSVATTPHQVSSINRFIAEEVNLYRGKMVGLGTLHPDSADILGDVEEIEALGLHGVKLHPDIQRFRADDDACAEIYALCEKKGLPILMHAGDHRYDYSNPNRLAPVLASHPALCMVAAHLGGWSVWEDAKEKLSGFSNLYVDTSSSFPFLMEGEAREIIEAFGVSHVLFATDYPMWHPKGEIEYLLRLGFTDEEYKMLFSENAKAVFGKENFSSLI